MNAAKYTVDPVTQQVTLDRTYNTEVKWLGIPQYVNDPETDQPKLNPDWEDLRKGRIGTSQLQALFTPDEQRALFGSKWYYSQFALWAFLAEKWGGPEWNPAMTAGNISEPFIREAINRREGLDGVPQTGLRIVNGVPLIASFDFRDGPITVEIKQNSREIHTWVMENLTTPPKHRCQATIGQPLVKGTADQHFYVSAHPELGISPLIPVSVDHVLETDVLTRAQTLWESVLSNTRWGDPLAETAIPLAVDDESFGILAARFKDIKANRKQAELELTAAGYGEKDEKVIGEALRQYVMRLPGEAPVEGYGLRVSRFWKDTYEVKRHMEARITVQK